MEDRVRFIEHKQQPILLIDFSRCPVREMMSVLADVQEIVANCARDSVLTLADFTGAQIDKDVATRIKEVLVFDRPYVKRSAWVGTESLPQVFYEGFKQFSQRDFPKFATREEAMEWLVKE